jgi:LysR family cys regulon transcriptional activator
MNFQQLRIVRETVRRNFNLSEAAAALFTSQSGVSKHIKDLEDELGIELFVRKGKRLLGLTEPGKELAHIVERMLLDARNIKGLADQFRRRDEGQLTIATTHTQARYALPKIVVEFKRLFPKVHLALHQGSPTEIVSMLQQGEADIGVATEKLGTVPELAAFPFYTWRHALIAPKGHPLASQPSPTLETVTEYPLITYHEGFTGRDRIDRAFADAGLAPDIVMSALDADVIKTYVALGLGVGIIASMAYDPEQNGHLTLLETRPLFAENVTHIAVRRGRYLRGYAYRFIELCSPGLTENAVRAALTPPQAPDIDV